MAISLVDKEVYTIYDYEFERGEMIAFFLNGHRDDVVIVYDGGQNYQGFITYKRLLKAHKLSEALCREYVCIDEDVWKNAYLVMETCGYETVPVFDKDNNLCYFAVWDNRLNGIMRKLEFMAGSEGGIKRFVSDGGVYLQGCNEILFRLREMLLAEGIPVSVSGEAWPLFGIEEAAVLDADAVAVKDSCFWITRLFDKHCRESMEQETALYLQRKIKNEGKRLIFACTSQRHAQAIYGMLLGEGFIPDELVCIDGRFEEYLFGRRLSDKSALDSENAVICIAGNENNEKCERLAKKYVLSGKNRDDIILPMLPDRPDYDDYIYHTIPSDGTVILSGDSGQCVQVRDSLRPYCARIIYGTEDPVSREDLECETYQECIAQKGALWFYVDSPFGEKVRASYADMYWRCQKKGIYLSDYYLNYFAYVGEAKKTEWRWLERLSKIKQETQEGVWETAEVLFSVAPYSYFWDSIAPLYRYYKAKGISCAVAFCKAEEIMRRGKKMFERFLQIMEMLIAEGTPCAFEDDARVYEHRYRLCFSNSGDHTQNITDSMRKSCDITAAVQTMAYYTHIEMGQIPFEKAFGKAALKNVDYLVVSDYAADWISKRTDEADGKLLALGYPKQDDLYHKLQKQDIPEEWKQIIGGRKAILFVTWSIEEYLRYFDGRDVAIIWRPHPLDMERKEFYNKVQQIKKERGIIVDTNASYSAAFAVSDAMISPMLSSVRVNWLFTGKPLLIALEQEDITNKECYSDKAWYQAAYIGEKDDDFARFVEMVEKGEDYEKEKHAPYYELMSRHFDGKVCERIYHYFK